MKNKIISFLTRPLDIPLVSSTRKKRELALFCRQYAAMLGSGISALGGLHLILEQKDSAMFKDKLQAVAQKVEKGHSLSDSFQEHNKLFPPLFSGMVAAGEAAGILDVVLERLALHYEKQCRLEQKLKSATAYPRFVLLVVAAVIVFLVSVVLPTFQGTFARMGIETPLLTKLFLAAGSFFVSYWHYLLFVLVTLFLLGRKIINTDKGFYIYSRAFFSIPIMGKIYQKVVLARFCRTFSTLLGCGVGIILSLELASQVINNPFFQEKISHVKKGVSRGESLADTFKKARLIPPIVVGLTEVGEQSGNLEELLSRAADYYEEEVEHTMDRLGEIIEPVLILFVAVIVGAVVLSIMLPMMGMLTGVG